MIYFRETFAWFFTLLCSPIYFALRAISLQNKLMKGTWDFFLGQSTPRLTSFTVVAAYFSPQNGFLV
jgi:hypothetical protein